MPGPFLCAPTRCCRHLRLRGGQHEPGAHALPPAWGVAVVCLGTLVVPFDSAVNVAFPAIIRAFALPIPAIQWVVIAYTLTYAALMLVFGRLGDMLGHRRVFLLGTGCSAAAFLACAAVAVLPVAAGGARGAGSWRSAGIVMRPGARHRAVSGIAAQPDPRPVHDGFRRSARRRGHCSPACWCSASAGTRCSGSAPHCRSRRSCSHGDCPPRCPPARASASTPIGAGAAGPGDQRVIARAQSAAAGRQRGAVPGWCSSWRRVSVHPARTPRRVPDHRSALFSRRGFLPC